ncbi:hypothetical protein RIF29_28694 [Crotalaria pallida]|uniref:Serine-threonine/tyrosine-protein kinase catalytic domain-containing protein n=1 Tax=Crotalaria pallida TaxID=3830 RepID=A0AAN9ED44_CROPI
MKLPSSNVKYMLAHAIINGSFGSVAASGFLWLDENVLEGINTSDYVKPEKHFRYCPTGKFPVLPNRNISGTGEPETLTTPPAYSASPPSPPFNPISLAPLLATSLTAGLIPVYKGLLFDGTQVAFKRFKNCSVAGVDSFTHEVQVIASVRHVNLVTLRDYCTATTNLEGHQRIIVTDLMENESLHDHLFGSSTNKKLSWIVREKIALGTASVTMLIRN